MHTLSRRTAWSDALAGLRSFGLGSAGALASAALSVFTTFLVWQERARGRAELCKMDDRMLKDIGLSRADIVREASKPIWRQ